MGAPALPLEPEAFDELEHWPGLDPAGALDSFCLSCREILDHGSGFARNVRFGGSRGAWLDICRTAFGARDARAFFETWFRPYRVIDAECPEGLFTGYFEPEVDGRRGKSPEFSVPIYRRPPDLVSLPEKLRSRSGYSYGRIVQGEAVPYLTRRDIEEGALSGQGLEVVYLRDWADAFFLHVQGSGRVRLEDGSTMRLAYEAKSGLPYTGIGSLLVERGVFSREDMSMQAIRRWMAENPGKSRALMWENQSFIFFREVLPDRTDLGAQGAQHVQLTPRLSLAVDRSVWMFGTPVWLDTQVPTGEEGPMKPLQQLMIAQDTGSAIKGLARGDVYWGFGEEAARIAGHMKSPGRMTVLLPIPVAAELGLCP